jgi:hypothetical protein
LVAHKKGKVMAGSVSQLERLNYGDKVFSWRQEQPLNHGERLSNQTEFLRHKVETDGSGNIVKMPELYRKPCFGIPTAFLRHYYEAATFIPRTKRREFNGRCSRCKVSKACEKVSSERWAEVAKRDPEFHELLGRWKDNNGLEQGGFAFAFKILHQGHWSRMVQQLRIQEFNSVNDPLVQEYWNRQDSLDRIKRQKKSFARIKRDWKTGKNISVLLERLADSRRSRVKLLVTAARQEKPPKYLKHISTESIGMTCKVWEGRQIAIYMDGKLNASAIATGMKKYADKMDGWSHNALRSRVKADLTRISKLESHAQYNGGTPIWPKYKMEP